MRFSLKTLITCVLVLALSLTLYRVYHRLNAATRELQVLRNELGYLNITDPDAIHFVSVPQLDDLKWSWRVWLPKNRKYRLCFKTMGISDDKFGSGNCVFFMNGGEEFSVTLMCRRDQRDEWHVTAATSKGHFQHLGPMTPLHEMWMKGEANVSYMHSGRHKTVSVQPSGPAELLRLRIQDGETASSDGILVWIVEEL